MAKKMSNKETLSVRVNSLEQQYIATCYPLPDRPGLENCYAWKEKLTQSANLGEPVDLQVPEITLAFPHLAGLAIKGFFENTSVQRYFEGLNEEGAHDKNLYLFAKKVSRNLKTIRSEKSDAVLASVLDHVNGCSVKPADLSQGRIWTFGAVIEGRVNQDYFDRRIGEKFVLTHGESDTGPIAIRELTEDEFHAYVQWFEKIQKSPRNPFNHGEKIVFLSK